MQVIYITYSKSTNDNIYTMHEYAITGFIMNVQSYIVVLSIKHDIFKK